MRGGNGQGGADGAGFGIRTARVVDAPAIAAVLGDWCRETDWMPKLHTRGQDLAFAMGVLSSQVVRLGRAGGGIGFLARKDHAVNQLIVAPQARGLGLGKALLNEAKAMGHLTLWTFQANLGARRFYAREGFREVEFTDGAHNEEKLPDVRLEWSA